MRRPPATLWPPCICNRKPCHTHTQATLASRLAGHAPAMRQLRRPSAGLSPRKPARGCASRAASQPASGVSVRIIAREGDEVAESVRRHRNDAGEEKCTRVCKLQSGLMPEVNDAAKQCFLLPQRKLRPKAIWPIYAFIQKLASGFQNGTARKACPRGSLSTCE